MNGHILERTFMEKKADPALPCAVVVLSHIILGLLDSPTNGCSPNTATMPPRVQGSGAPTSRFHREIINLAPFLIMYFFSLARAELAAKKFGELRIVQLQMRLDSRHVSTS